MLTYAQLGEAASVVAERLAEKGVGPGDKVGVRIRSGSTDLYVAILGILGILVAGAAYVPIDADDPDERAPADGFGATGPRGRRVGDLHLWLDR